MRKHTFRQLKCALNSASKLRHIKHINHHIIDKIINKNQKYKVMCIKDRYVTKYIFVW